MKELSPNIKLACLVVWADQHGVSLDDADIDCSSKYIKFWHSRESRHNFRLVKRAVDNFLAEGKPPYVVLRKEVFVDPLEEFHEPECATQVDFEDTVVPHDCDCNRGRSRWMVRWEGAYECNVSYTCGPQAFANHEAAEAEDIPNVDRDENVRGY